MDFVHRYRLYFGDWLRTGSLPGWRALWQFLGSLIGKSPQQKLRAAANYLMHRPAGALSQAAVHQARVSAARVAELRPRIDCASVIRSAVVKSRKSAAEPGIILVSFESELRKILALARYAKLQDSYRICFMPTWQNFFSPEVVELDVRATNPYYLLPSNFSESSLRYLLGSHSRILPFHAASWVNHNLSCTQPVVKDIDIIMLANFSSLKRHWKLFEALRSLPKDLRIVLVGVPLQQRDKQSLLREAQLFQVADRVTIFENASQETVQDLLERAKLMCALSHREGSYVGVAEALLANTPVAMYSNAMIGTKAYINDKTGILLKPGRPLAQQLLQALAISESLQPRTWAIDTISAESNCRRLNSCFKDDYLAARNEWTEDIADFYCMRFELFYSDQSDEIATNCAEDSDRIEKEFGLTLERPVVEAASIDLERGVAIKLDRLG